MLDVQQFCPNEIAVKTIDNYIVIEGKHEEKEDEHGYVARHFVRRYLLPKGVKPESVTSTISCDGVLTISAPKEVNNSNPNISNRILALKKDIIHLT
jgi:crystallin alpha B